MAEDIIHYKKYSVVRGHIRIALDLSRYASRFPGAQRWLGEQVLQSCRALMPLRTGNLQQRSNTELEPLHDRSSVADGGRQVVFPGPSARYLYMGKVMVDEETGKGPRKIPTGPGGEYILRFRKGAHLKPTARSLSFSRPEAVDHWFEAAKERYGAAWIQGVKHYIRTGRA